MKQKEPHATFTLRLPRELAGQIQQRSGAARMSMNAWMLRALDIALVTKISSASTGPAIVNEPDIERRALLAHRKSAARQGFACQEPSACEVHEVGGSAYARLSNMNGVLAVYRVHRGGKLQGLTEWPSALN